MLSGIASAACEKSYTIHSPDRTIGITLTVGNRIAYEVRVDGRTVVAPTPVAMTLDDGTVWGGSAQPSRIRKGMVDTSFATPFYIKKRVADHYNWLRADFRQGFAIELRAYDDGVAYRFISTTDRSLVVASEEAGAAFPEDWTCWVPYVRDCDGTEIVPFGSQFKTSFENLYTVTRLSKLDPARLAFLPLVVAADDGIMPQTIESINHAKAANVKVIVAINKMDKPTANPERVKEGLTKYGLIPEDWGGDVACIPVSAMTGMGINDLLERIALEAEVMELKANPNRRAKGAVVEARLDKGQGPIATILVQNGTLHSGDVIIAGTAVGRVRTMRSDKGKLLSDAGPSTPVEITGLTAVPEAGDLFEAVEDERLARELAEQRIADAKEKQFSSFQKVTLDNLFSQMAQNDMKELAIVVKADVQGSAEAVKQSLEKISNDEVRVRVIHAGVGAISKSDVDLADASNAIIIGFNVRPDNVAKEEAAATKVEMRMYRVIYDAINDVTDAMKGMLAPKFREVSLGELQVRQVYKISNVGTVAGCRVTSGKITRDSKVRVVRDGIVIAEDEIASLKRFKDDAKEVAEGYECGVTLEKFADVKEGDVYEAFKMEEYRD